MIRVLMYNETSNRKRLKAHTHRTRIQLLPQWTNVNARLTVYRTTTAV